MIEIKDLTYAYKLEEDIIVAIDGVNFNIEEGSFIAIIGENGSGKSTLAKNINGLLLPSGGSILVDGFDTVEESTIWNVRQLVGMVFQNPDNQLVSAIIEDDIAFGPENLGIEPDEIRKRVDESLKAINMYDYRKKSAHLLSGGQKQRIAIGGILAMKPKYIVFDEPTAMLDPEGRKDVLNIIKKLNQEGIATILITHFMEETINADRLIIMDQGKVAMDKTPIEVYEHIDELRRLNLDVPMIVDLADRLRKRGHNIPKELFSLEEMVDFLCG